MDALKGFKIVHLNCRSLYAKLTQLELLYADVDVLCLTETWLHDSYSDNILFIEGKELYRWDRSNGLLNGVTKSRGGGLACYLNNSISSDSQIQTPLCVTTPDIELLTVKLSPKTGKTRYILTVYRPPEGDIDSFFHILENILLLYNLSNYEIWIVGDFNIDFLKRTHKNTKKAIDFARVYGLRQIITEPTHLTGFSRSCIDLMFTNACFVASSGVLNDVISDHFPTYACIKKKREAKEYARVRARTYTSYDKVIFQTILKNEDWNVVHMLDDPNEIWTHIFEKINNILCTMCPIKYIRVTTNKPYWLSHHILECINDRNSLYAKAKRNNTAENLGRARQARNTTNRLISSAKEEFIKDSLESNRSDPKKFWRIINNTIINNNSKNGHINLVNNDGIGLSLEDSCRYMNDYLVSIGDNLEREFCSSNTNLRPPRHYIDQLLNDYVITKEDVLAILKEIDNSKGSGMDLVPTFILKDAFSSIPTVVAYLMNQSLKTGIFPKDWALAIVTPIPKVGDLSNVKNLFRYCLSQAKYWKKFVLGY